MDTLENIIKDLEELVNHGVPNLNQFRVALEIEEASIKAEADLRKNILIRLQNIYKKKEYMYVDYDIEPGIHFDPVEIRDELKSFKSEGLVLGKYCRCSLDNLFWHCRGQDPRSCVPWYYD